uniref:7TM_GPCR_Srx domain-containing protein n=1 Tax=Haemonchus contortus TaxID=6289 RepID=A0A7I4Y203_HAECO
MEMPSSLQWPNRLAGQISLLFMESCFQCSFVVTINRFVAVIYPTLYRKAFNERTTAVMLLLTTTLSLIYFSLYFVDGCSFYYEHKSDAWTFGTDFCSQNLALYIDMCFNIALFSVSCAIDVIVFMRLRSSTKKMMTTSGTYMERESRLRLRRETLLFAQAILNSFLYSFMLLCFHVIAQYTSSSFGQFFLKTLVWSVAHSVDGLIIIYLNPEIKRHLVGIRHFVQFIRDPVSSNAERIGPAYSTTIK